MPNDDLLARLQALEDKGVQLSIRSTQLGRRGNQARRRSDGAQARARAARAHAERTLSRRAGIWRALRRSQAA